LVVLKKLLHFNVTPCYYPLNHIQPCLIFLFSQHRPCFNHSLF